VNRTSFLKILALLSLILAIGWLAATGSSHPLTTEKTENLKLLSNSDEYVGSEACKDCHEDQFKAFSHTSHAQLAKLSSWNGKVTGCEACHGPGKAHLEEGDPKKIISFKNKSPKEISETCLVCHAGKEE